MLARELISLHEAPREAPLFSESYPRLSAAAGYEAARALHEHRVASGWRAVGRKIGFTNRTIWPRYGVYEPIWGTVYDRTLIRAVDNHARVPLQGLVNPRIEPEICFGLRSIPDRRRLTDCIEWMAHSIEIVQCHHMNWKLTLADATTDNGLHGRLIVGAPVALPGDPAARRARRPRRQDRAAGNRRCRALVRSHREGAVVALRLDQPLEGEPAPRRQASVGARDPGETRGACRRVRAEPGSGRGRASRARGQGAAAAPPAGHH